jgi:hypothetical protein
MALPVIAVLTVRAVLFNLQRIKYFPAWCICLISLFNLSFVLILVQFYLYILFLSFALQRAALL